MFMRNIYNVDEVEHLIDQVASDATSDAVDAWLRRTARHWILTEHPDLLRLAVDGETDTVLLFDTVPPEALRRRLDLPASELPAWCRKALDSGREVHYLHLGAALEKKLRRVAEYLNAVGVEAHGGKLDHLSFEAAQRLTRIWRRNQWAAEQRQAGIRQVYRGDDGVRIVQLQSAASLADEGDRMAHCAGGYAFDVENGDCEIYSLRDANDKPRATIEVVGGNSVEQVKGRANGDITEAARRHVRSFIRTRGYDIGGDHWNIGEPVALGNVRALRNYLRSDEGRRQLRRFVFSRNDPLGRADLVTMISSIMYRNDALSLDDRSILHDLLLPPRDDPVRLRRVGAYHVYDDALPLVRVEVAAAWLSLASNGVFDGIDGVRERYVMLRDRAEGALAALALHDPDRVFLLGRVAYWELESGSGWVTPADVVSNTALDVFPAIRRRHEALRHRVNRQKARSVGRRAPVSEAHRDFRRLLEGSWAEMVI